jgi:hypothetical protein
MTDLEEAIHQPLEDPLTKWRHEAEEQEERFARAREMRLRSAAPVHTNWSAEIDQRIAAEHAFLIEVIGEAFGQERVQTDNWMRQLADDLIRPLRVELAELRISNAELQAANVELRALFSGGITDLPTLPLRGSRAN